MTSQKIVDYLKIYRAKGYTLQQLKEFLAQNGIDRHEIDESISFISSEEKFDAGMGMYSGIDTDTTVKVKITPYESPAVRSAEVKIISLLYLLFAAMLLAYTIIVMINPRALPSSEFLKSIIGQPTINFEVFTFEQFLLEL